MKKIFFILFAAVFSLPFLYGFISEHPNTNVAQTISREQSTVSGDQLFQKNCAACHGIDRQGNPPAFPSLVSVSERLQKYQVKKLLQTGRNAMPSFTHLSEQEREAITGFLFGETTFAEQATEITPEQNGQRLFIANCSRCHKATPDDQQPPDQREWGMQPAVLGGITSRYELENFRQILNIGPCYMPSFSFLEDKDKTDIYTWLQTIEDLSAETSTLKGMSCRMKCKKW